MDERYILFVLGDQINTTIFAHNPKHFLTIEALIDDLNHDDVVLLFGSEEGVSHICDHRDYGGTDGLVVSGSVLGDERQFLHLLDKY